MKVHRAAPWVSESQMGAFSAALYGTTAVAMVFINKAVLSGYHFTVLPQALNTRQYPTFRHHKRTDHSPVQLRCRLRRCRVPLDG
jgi:hypothetical protein